MSKNATELPKKLDPKLTLSAPRGAIQRALNEQQSKHKMISAYHAGKYSDWREQPSPKPSKKRILSLLAFLGLSK